MAPVPVTHAPACACRWVAGRLPGPQLRPHHLPGYVAIVAVRWSLDDRWVAVQIVSNTRTCPQILVFSSRGALLTRIQHGTACLKAWVVCPGSRGILAVTAPGPAERRLARSNVTAASPMLQNASITDLPAQMQVYNAEHFVVSADASLVVTLVSRHGTCCVLFASTASCELLATVPLPSSVCCACTARPLSSCHTRHCLLLGPYSLAVSHCRRQGQDESFATVLHSAQPGRGLGSHIATVEHGRESGKAFSPCGTFLALTHGTTLLILEAQSGDITHSWFAPELCSDRFARLFGDNFFGPAVQWARGGWQLHLSVRRLCPHTYSYSLAVVQFWPA